MNNNCCSVLQWLIRAVLSGLNGELLCNIYSLLEDWKMYFWCGNKPHFVRCTVCVYVYTLVSINHSRCNRSCIYSTKHELNWCLQFSSAATWSPWLICNFPPPQWETPSSSRATHFPVPVHIGASASLILLQRGARVSSRTQCLCSVKFTFSLRELMYLQIYVGKHPFPHRTWRGFFRCLWSKYIPLSHDAFHAGSSNLLVIYKMHKVHALCYEVVGDKNCHVPSIRVT